MYEITFISKEEIDPGVKKIIESQNGKITNESGFGRRKLAYPIGKEQSGCYFTYVFEVAPEQIEEINKKIRLESKIIRYLLIQKIIHKSSLKKEAKTLEKIKTPKEEIVVPKIEIITEKATTPIKKTTKKVEKEKKSAISKPAKKTKTEQPTKKKEVEITEEERLQALNDKLSELLKE